MPVLFQAGSGPVTVITNAYSAGGTNSSADIRATRLNNMRETLSGALTANTLATAYTKTGRGCINNLNVYTKDGTVRTVRCRVTIDGTVCFDATSSAIGSDGYGMVVIGITAASNEATVSQQIVYQESCLIEIASSLTETDKIAIGLNAEEWAS